MKHDQIVDALETEIRLFRAAAPAGSKAAERLLKPALDALDYHDKEQMFDEFVRLKRLRQASNRAGTPLS
jgi:hypothetical protein